MRDSEHAEFCCSINFLFGFFSIALGAVCNLLFSLSVSEVMGKTVDKNTPDAVLADGVWHYKPPLAPLERLNLARSGYGADDGTDYRADYSLCWDGRCHGMAKLIGTPAVAPLVEVSACRS